MDTDDKRLDMHSYEHVSIMNLSGISEISRLWMTVMQVIVDGDSKSNRCSFHAKAKFVFGVLFLSQYCE